jgi:LemA protein
MKKGLIVGGVIVGVVVILIMMFSGTYNSLVSKEEEVDGKLSDISVQLERRADLIPNLVSTVKGYAKHEKAVIDSVTDARSKLVNADDAEEMAEANQELTSAINKLLVIVENYPDLKANTNFIQLQDELAGTENRISVARNDYNEAVKDYNKTIKSFPKNILAGMFGFEEKEYFVAKESSNEVPEVSFE